MRRRTIGQRQSEASRDKDGIGQRIDKAHSVNQATQEALGIRPFFAFPVSFAI